MLSRSRQTIIDRPASTLGVVASLALALAGCGGSELDVQTTFDGEWSVAGLVIEGRVIDVAGSGLLIEIDTAEAALRGSTGCGRVLGSYTLESNDEGDGDASVTIPSPAPDESCAMPDRDRHEALVAALESVTQWRREGNVLRLLGPQSSGSQPTAVELRPAGRVPGRCPAGSVPAP